MKKKISDTYSFILISSFVMTFAGCSKNDNSTPEPAAAPVVQAPAAKLPVLVTSDVTFTPISPAGKITGNTGGNISADGGANVSARGVCWSTRPKPTIADRITNDGGGTGMYKSELPALIYGRYYARAYATNSVGTAYGNEQVFVTLPYGTFYMGGIVAYILQPGDPGYLDDEMHGLVMQQDRINKNEYHTVWSNKNYMDPVGTSTALGSGLANTTAIVKLQGSGYYAAALCYDLVENGYDDWFLPSKDELNKIYSGYKNYGLWGLASANFFWSSSQVGSTTSWIQRFTDGVQSTYDIRGSVYVRAVRAF